MLGDLLCAVPALRAFRAALPRAEITLVGLPWARELAARFRHLVDDFLAVPGFPGLAEAEPDAGEFQRFVREARRRRFDLAIQLHGSGRVSNALASRLGARRLAGFHPARTAAPDAALFVTWPEEGHEIHRLLRLPEGLGLPTQGDRLEFPLGEADLAELGRAAPGLERGGYAVVHPGARSARRWPAAGFAAVADALAARGLEIVLTGSEEERTVTAPVARAMRAPARDLAGRTSLGALGALVSGARIVVANDTGISHVAAAVDTASVVVATTSDPARWAPLDHGLHRVLVRPDPELVVAEASALLAA